MRTAVLAVGLLLPMVLPFSVDREDLPEPPAAKIERSVNVYSIEGSVERVAAPKATAKGSTLTIGSDVLFAFASAEVDAAAQSALAAQLDQIPVGAQVTVAGHTDARGGDAVNLPLSASRAEAVATVLRTSRADLVLVVVGMGSSEPVASESNEKGMATNRRVELSWSA